MLGYGTSPIELMASDAMLRGEIFCEHFVYSASWIAGTATALAASATVEAQINITGDADFVIQELNLTSWSALAIPTIADLGVNEEAVMPDFLIMIVIAGSGRQIMNVAQPVANVCGSHQINMVPGRLPMPKLVQSSNAISCVLTNRTAVAPNRVDLSFIGFKVFYQGGNRQQIFHVL